MVNGKNPDNERFFIQLGENWAFVYFDGIFFCQVIVKLTVLGCALSIKKSELLLLVLVMLVLLV